jgi:hypothetical protein
MASSVGERRETTSGAVNPSDGSDLELKDDEEEEEESEMLISCASWYEDEWLGDDTTEAEAVIMPACLDDGESDMETKEAEG